MISSELQLLLAITTVIGAVLAVMLVLVQSRLQSLKNDFERNRGDNEQQAASLALFQKMLDLQEARDAKRSEEIALFREVSLNNQRTADATNQLIVRLVERFDAYINMQRGELTDTRQAIVGTARQAEIGIEGVLDVVTAMSKTLLEKAALDEQREIENAKHIRETHTFMVQAYGDLATLKKNPAVPSPGDEESNT